MLNGNIQYYKLAIKYKVNYYIYMINLYHMFDMKNSNNFIKIQKKTLNINFIPHFV